MDSSRWQRVQDLFHQATDLPPAQHRAFLASACGDDDALARDVQAMLEEDGRASSLLDQNVAEVAHQVLGGESLPLPNQVFGPYHVLRLLGEGGMGIVYLAEREDLRNQVAIKVLRDAWLSPARRERFASEQRTLARLNHPSIAKLYDADSLDDGTPWFVMEHVEGLSLTGYCLEHACSVEERLRLFRAVCEAVQYAHAQTVIHRDLKPSNILVKNDGSIRLLDFGIAKQLESLDAPMDQTMTGLRLLTPAYASPEQIRGGHVGVQTDVYSLGVVLFELLTGKLPFDLSKMTPAEATKVITETAAGRPSHEAALNRTMGSLGKSAWADLDVLCLTAMHKDPMRRYRSVEALIRDIDHYLKGVPLEARPDTLAYRASKFIRRNWRAVAATAAVFAIIAGLSTFYTVRLARARNTALAEAARTLRVQQFMTNLFEGGDESAGPSEDLKVATLIDRGAREAQALNTDPKVQAELYLTLGNLYDKLGKFDKAEPLLRRALDQRRALFGPDSSEVAESMVALGWLQSDQAKMQEAEQLVRQGLEMEIRHLPSGHPAIGRSMSTLGTIMVRRGQYEQAVSVLDDAVQLQSAAGSDNADLSESLTELANAHFYLGHYAISNSLNLRVLELDRKRLGDRHPNVAEDMTNLGAIASEQGHYVEAEQYYRQAVDIMQSFYGKDHPETASLKTQLGRALVAQDRLPEADGILREALASLERTYGKVHPRVASVLSDLGKIAQKQGRLDEAQQDFERITEIYRSVYNGKHYYIGNALCNLAGVYVDKKEYERGERLFHEALDMYGKTLPADHQMIGIARLRLGRALLAQKRYADAETESRGGYEILMKLSSPPPAWLSYARNDLAGEYSAMNQPEKAAAIRAMLSTESSPQMNAGKR